jgi:signal transduction histidine kinase
VERWEQCDLRDIATRAIDQARAEAITAGVALDEDLALAPTRGDPALLERLTGNLIENAIRHNVGPGGTVHIGTGVDDGGAWLRVTNTGRVLDPERVPALFEPFRRETDRTGTSGFGLGLSIVQSIADAHGSRVSAIAPPEGGLHVTVAFALSAPDRVASSSSPIERTP